MLGPIAYSTPVGRVHETASASISGRGRGPTVCVGFERASSRQVARLTIPKRVDQAEYRVRESGPAVPSPELAEWLGLHGCEVRIRDGVDERVAGASHRRKQYGLAYSLPKDRTTNRDP